VLILQRKIGQAIRIGDNVEVVVLAVSGDHVRLGIEAPREVRVLRHELVQEVEAVNRDASAAAQAPPASLGAVLGAITPHRPPPLQ
jgi:carbon storage regulator